MERIMNAQALRNDNNMNQFMKSKKIFELNPEHPTILNLKSLDNDKFSKAVYLLYNTSLLSSGFSIDTGVSKYKSETNMGGFRVKSFLNIGISIYYISSKSYSRERENEFGIAPFINLESRF